MRAHTTLILGGARSGKTKRALELAKPLGSPIYIATAEAKDDEMRDRIAHHQAERGAHWTTIEAPLDLVGALGKLTADEETRTGVVVDCLTLWLSNIMLANRDVMHEADLLVRTVGSHTCPLIFVSNEVGFGLVPETALGRAFRDAQGHLNQRMAEVADVVELVVSGLPMRLKP